MLNNQMDDFSLQSGVANGYGLIQSDANLVGPGKRPLSSMTPTIVVKDGKLFMTAGAPGGGRISTAVLQVILNVIDFGMNVQDAIDAHGGTEQIWLMTKPHTQLELVNSSGKVVPTLKVDAKANTTKVVTKTSDAEGALVFRYVKPGKGYVVKQVGGSGESKPVTVTITVTVADDDTQSDTKTTSVTVNNVAPVVGLNAVPSINENGTATLTGSYTDIGLQDAHQLTVNWGDPNNGANSVFNIPATSTLSGTPTFTSTGADTTTILTITSFNATTGLVTFSVQHQYLDDGLAGVRLAARRLRAGGAAASSETARRRRTAP